MSKFAIFILIPAILMTLSLSAAAQTFPSVWALAGDGNATVERGGEKLTAKMRDRMKEGDVVKTDKKTGLRLVYDSGTAIILSNDTTVEFLPHQGNVPVVKLDTGTVEAIVEKSFLVTGKPSHRLFLQTKSTVIGAGGTDFILDGGNITEIHALTGAVDAAKSMDELKAGKGVEIVQGEMAISGEKGLSKPQSFDENTYWKAFEHVRPLLVQIRKPRAH